MIFFVASFTMGGLNFVVTILNLRVKGLSMMRLPLTTSAPVHGRRLGLLAFPALAAGAILLLFDRHAGTSFFLPAGMYIADQLQPNQGGSPLMWQHLFWFLGHPEVYIIMLPAMGFASDIIATLRDAHLGYRAMVYAIIAIGTLSFLVWGHHMFVSGMSPFLGSVFVTTTLAIAIPSAVKTFNWLATLWRARIRFKTPMLFALAVVSLFVTGGLSGLFLGTSATDIQLHDTYFVVGHFHFIMAGAGLFGAFAAFYFWFPKMYGRFLNERLGKAHFWVTFIAYYATFFPMHYLGVAGMMRRIYDPNVYEYLKPLAPVDQFITIFAFILGTAQFLFLINLFWSMYKGKKAGANPWESNTLESGRHLRRRATAIGRVSFRRSVVGPTNIVAPTSQRSCAAVESTGGSRSKELAQGVKYVMQVRSAVKIAAVERPSLGDLDGSMSFLTQKLADYLILAKARLSVMVLATGLVGYWLASGSAPDLAGLAYFGAGCFLVIAGANAFNQVIERSVDGHDAADRIPAVADRPDERRRSHSGVRGDDCEWSWDPSVVDQWPHPCLSGISLGSVSGGLYASQESNSLVHVGGGRVRRHSAADGLERRGRRVASCCLGPFRDFVPVAVPSYLFHRSSLSRGLHARRLPGASAGGSKRTSNPRTSHRLFSGLGDGELPSRLLRSSGIHLLGGRRPGQFGVHRLRGPLRRGPNPQACGTAHGGIFDLHAFDSCASASR